MPSTSCRCPTSGSIRGSRPGTSPFTASPWPTWTPPSPSTSSILLCREWFQHPNGALPAYEWDFGDVNPPVQAWAALEVFAIDGGRDIDFLSRVFDKLLVNFTWWVNLEDREGNNLFEGGFLGLDNIGPIDRSHLPVGGHPRAIGRHGVDGFLRLGHGRHRRRALNRAGQPARRKIWCSSSSSTLPPSARPWKPGAVGRHRRPVLRPAGHPGRDPGAGEGPLHGRDHPESGAAVVDGRDCSAPEHGGRASSSPRLLRGAASTTWTSFGALASSQGEPGEPAASARRGRRRPPGAASSAKLFDEREFLSPYGLRAISAYHRDHPYELDVEGFGPASTTSRRSRPPPCSAATPTGGGRCGSRSTTW